MKALESKIIGVLIIETDVFGDHRGFAHRFLNLTDDVEFRYKCDNVYNKESEVGMRYDAPEINMDWGSLLNGIEPVLSEKDKVGSDLDDSKNEFVYGENC